jgi:hypothetical protein
MYGDAVPFTNPSPSHTLHPFSAPNNDAATQRVAASLLPVFYAFFVGQVLMPRIE